MINGHLRQRLARPLALTLVALALLLLSAQPAAWATPAQRPAVQTVPTITPNRDGDREAETAQPNGEDGNNGDRDSRDCQPSGQPQPLRIQHQSGERHDVGNCPWSLTIPDGAINRDGALEFRLVQPNGVPAPNSGDAIIGAAADLILLDTDGKPVARPTFDQPIQVCFSYSANELARAGDDPARLFIQFYDVNAGAWVALPTTFDAANRRICAAVSHFTLFSAAAKLPVPAALPVTGGPTDPTTWLWGLIALSLGIGGGLMWRAGRARRARPGQPPAK